MSNDLTKFFGNRQSKTDLPIFATIKWFHDLLTLISRNRLTVIDHQQAKLAFGHVASQFDLLIRRLVAQCIFHQIIERLRDQAVIEFCER